METKIMKKDEFDKKDNKDKKNKRLKKKYIQ